MASKRCFLLDIPEELRLEIYDYLVRPAEIFLVSWDQPTITGKSTEVAAATTFSGKPHQFDKRFKGEKVHTALLRTCRKIYKESIALLTMPSLLNIHPLGGCILDNPGYFVDISQLSKLAHLEVLELQLGAIRTTFAETLLHCNCVISYLSKELHVKRLKVTIEDCPPEDRAHAKNSTQLEHVQQLLGGWTWLRPAQSFEYEIELRGKVTDWGGWDTRAEKVDWVRGRMNDDLIPSEWIECQSTVLVSCQIHAHDSQFIHTPAGVPLWI